MSTTELTPRQQKKRSALEAIPPIERSVENGVLRVTRRFRALSLEQAIGYLESLGGERVSDGEIEGDGWRAELSTATVLVGPSYRLTEGTIT